MRAQGAGPPVSLPRQLTGVQSPIVWAIGLLVAIESTVLLLFVTSYYYLRLATPVWPPAGVEAPELLRPAIGVGLLLASVLPGWAGLRQVKRGRTWALLLGLPAGMLLAAAYLGIQVVEYVHKDYLWTAHAYGSMDWSMTAYASMHVVTLLLIAGVMWVLGVLGHFGPDRYTGLQALVFYWVFVAAGSLLFFGTQYLTPHITGGGP